MTVYPDLSFPEAPSDRPYVFCNMVATIDGKTVSGGRDEPVQDLGSRLDHATMHWLEAQADAIVMGAETVRATPIFNLPTGKWRVCVSRTGRVNPESTFFTRGEAEKTFLLVPETARGLAPAGLRTESFGPGDTVDFGLLLAYLKAQGVERVLVEGGSEINAEFLRLGVVDELFLTIAPKVRLGRGLPTYAGGEPLAKGALLQFDLVSCVTVENEVFLRYRRAGQ